MPYKDKEKQRLYHQQWSRDNPQWWEERRLRNRLIIREAKTRPCADCGIQYPYYVMQFDHVDGKELSLAIVAKKHWSEDHIRREIAKCEVVCANCHCERTAKCGGYDT